MNRTTWCMTIGLGACLTGVGMLAGTPTESGRPVAPAGDDLERSTIPDWRDRLRRADTALSEGDAARAERAWDEAYRLALATSDPYAMIEVGRAYLPIGEVVYDHPMAAARARRIFLSALFLGRGLRNVHAVADSAEALAVLGDHDLAARAFRIAVTLAQRGRDTSALDRITAQRDRVLAPQGEEPGALHQTSETVQTR
jgi:thioredoxin-like negative regulator of GroEL